MSGPPFDLAGLILTLRPDLCEKFGFSKPGKAGDFRRWLLLTGTKEYRSVLEDEGLLDFLVRVSPLAGAIRARHDILTPLQRLVREARPDVRKAFPLPRKHRQFVRWFFTHGVEEHRLWPFLSEEERRTVIEQPEPWKSRLAGAAASFAQDPGLGDVNERGFGVNLIGYVFGQLGIGEDLRMAARALDSAGVPFAAVNFPPGSEVPQNDLELGPKVTERGEFAFNIFCLSALEHGRFYAERGGSQMAGRYNIGFWPWELGKWPRPWEQISALADEVWVSSRHTLEALRPACPVPVFLMPMAVDTGEISPAGRPDFGLPPNARLFCFSFDLNSSFHRKNPMACVAAFLRAFPAKRGVFRRERPTRQEVGLVIKAHRPSRPSREWDRLRSIAKRDSRIHLIEETLPRPDLLALYSCCDCFVSLHRAEGYGRSIAEALLLGLHVIATGYSGNVDFCAPPSADLVNYRLVPVKRGEYPFGEGQLWAEADIGHAAELMRRFAERSPSPPRSPAPPKVLPGLRGATSAGENRFPPEAPGGSKSCPAAWGGAPAEAKSFPGDSFSCRNAGGRYRARLERIWESPAMSPDRLRVFPRTSRPTKDA